MPSGSIGAIHSVNRFRKPSSAPTAKLNRGHSLTFIRRPAPHYWQLEPDPHARTGCTSVQAGVATFSPTMPTMISMTLIRRPGWAGSRSNAMPRATVPTAPTPTQMEYAVPTGSDLMAIPRNQRLIIIADTVHTVGHRRVKPSVYFSPTAQPTSRSSPSRCLQVRCSRMVMRSSVSLRAFKACGSWSGR